MMINEALKRSFIGLGFAAIVTFIALTIMMMTGSEQTVATIWENMLGSMLVGVYFGVASLIFEKETWSPLKQTTIHFLVSISIWLPIAFYLGWVPMGVVPLLIAITLFVVSYAMFWLGTRMYFLKLEKEMNRTVSKNN
ncbi:DUF3021 domain-containing protein [Filobacillus milosensis]|uniref:DUF3021 domain-containing protein n=1 Tax=Filobacillus milosensis TaxID=94137 RepID=A0A4Y8IC54_9BACI|nr:DUF3021 domain-containing protein [Filobacillus milosensis]TFB13473.1 DUF3021 domain-containing protein [Filobacillus milosensis]